MIWDLNKVVIIIIIIIILAELLLQRHAEFNDWGKAQIGTVTVGKNSGRETKKPDSLCAAILKQWWIL